MPCCNHHLPSSSPPSLYSTRRLDDLVFTHMYSSISNDIEDLACDNPYLLRAVRYAVRTKRPSSLFIWSACLSTAKRLSTFKEGDKEWESDISSIALSLLNGLDEDLESIIFDLDLSPFLKDLILDEDVDTRFKSHLLSKARKEALLSAHSVLSGERQYLEDGGTLYSEEDDEEIPPF